VQLVQVAPASAGRQRLDAEELALKTRTEWADSGEAAGWLPRTEPDTVGALRAGDAVLVHPFVRAWSLDRELAGEGYIEPEGEAADTPDILAANSTPHRFRIYAHWIDGEPAAIERMVDGICVRSLGFALPGEGDALLRPEFQRFLAALEEPCGIPTNYEPLPSDFMAELAGPEERASREDIARADFRTTPLMPWLLGTALLIALAEMALRRRQRGGGVR
jgi:hypothetical protein